MKRNAFLKPDRRRPIDEARVLALLREGRTTTEVCRMVHVRRERIVELRQAAGILPKRGHRPRKPFDRERALELLRAAMPPCKVAAAVSAPRPAVYALARELGLVRSKGGVAGDHTRRLYAKAAADAPHFTCARCGKRISLENGAPGSADGFIRIGGRTVCVPCAERRFPRRAPDYSGGYLGDRTVAVNLQHRKINHPA